MDRRDLQATFNSIVNVKHAAQQIALDLKFFKEDYVDRGDIDSVVAEMMQSRWLGLQQDVHAIGEELQKTERAVSEALEHIVQLKYKLRKEEAVMDSKISSTAV